MHLLALSGRKRWTHMDDVDHIAGVKLHWQPLKNDPWHTTRNTADNPLPPIESVRTGRMSCDKPNWANTPKQGWTKLQANVQCCRIWVSPLGYPACELTWDCATWQTVLFPDGCIKKVFVIHDLRDESDDDHYGNLGSRYHVVSRVPGFHVEYHGVLMWMQMDAIQIPADDLSRLSQPRRIL